MEQKATVKHAGMAEKRNGDAKGDKPHHNYKKNINSNTETDKEAKFEGTDEELKG